MARQPIRVLLVDMPQLLRDLIEHAIATDPDLDVVGTEPDVEALERAAGETDPEFVIIGLDHGDLPESARAFLEARSRPRMLGLEADEGTAVLYELTPRRVPIGAVTPEELAGAIRHAAVAR